MSTRTFQGHTPTLGERVFVDPSAVLIGDIEIGEDSSVWPLTVIRGDMHRIRIGQRTSIQDGSVLHITHAGPFNPDGFPLTIGDEVTVGHKVTLHGCTLGNRILVGMGSILMDGAVVEDDVIIGAGSLVPPGKTLESGFLYVGKHLGLEARGVAIGLELVRDPTYRFFNGHTGYYDVDGQCFLKRGGCCRYYTSERGSYCATCILRPPTEHIPEIRRRYDLPAAG